MSGITRHALRVYAAITELRGTDNDVLDALIPFFDPILELMDGKVFDPHVFSAGVRKLYRWRFTGDIASHFIPRLERKGFLERKASTQEGTIWMVRYKTDNITDDTSIVSIFNSIIDEFEKFPPRVTDLLYYQRTRPQLEDILIRFLTSMDAVGEGAYSPQLGDLDPGGDTQTLLAQLEEGGRPLEPDDRYMCARFVRHLTKNKPEFIPHLVRLSSIALLTEVVEDFVRPINREESVDLTIILDAPLALDYLGCSGKALKDDTDAIITSLKTIGVKFIVLPISVAEMQRNLRTMLALDVTQRHGYTHNALIKREVSIEYVTAVANAPERALENAGITVRPINLDSQPNIHRYFSVEQYEDFLSTIQWGSFMPAREHDATCATIVMRLREGRHSGDLFKCRYAMVTRNPTFVRQARNYSLSSRMITEYQEGPVVLQRELATTAWLRTGLGGDDSVPRGRLIATCERVLQVRPEVRAALAAQLTKITPERLEQLDILMQDARSVQKLADETLNNENAITPTNAEHLLDVMRAATAEELKVAHEAEMAAERKDREQYKERTDAEIGELRRQIEESREIQIARMNENRQIFFSHVDSVNKIAKYVEFSFIFFLIALGALGLVNHFFGVLTGSKMWNVVLFVAGGVGTIRLIFAALERPMPGLVTFLNAYCRRALARRTSRMAVDITEFDKSLDYKGGRIHRKPKSIAPQEE